MKGRKMAKIKDLTGQRFGRLVALYPTGERRNSYIVWHCRCDCGNEVDVITSSLTTGHTNSCGCYSRECTIKRSTTHGMAQQRERHLVYYIWGTMIQRCENPKNKNYENYGGRGIMVCDEWHDAAVFIDWALASGWEKGLTLDRIDNNGNYEPSNCHWVTQKEQARNKRNNHLITFNGKTQSLAAWADETGIPYGTLESRINKLYWSIERALSV